MSQVTFSFDAADQQSDGLFVRKNESFTITAENEAITEGNVEIFFFRQSRPRQAVKLADNSDAIITADGDYLVINKFGFDGYFVARSSSDFEGALDITLEDNVDLVQGPNLFKRPDGSTYLEVYDDHVNFPDAVKVGGVGLVSQLGVTQILTAADSPVNLTAAQSGTAFTVRPGAGDIEINLPAAVAGVSYRFHYSTLPLGVEDGEDVLIQTPTDTDIIDGLIIDGEGSAQQLNSHGKVTFVGDASGDNARAGDWVELSCDGSRWNLRGATFKALGITIASWE